MRIPRQTSEGLALGALWHVRASWQEPTGVRMLRKPSQSLKSPDGLRSSERGLLCPEVIAGGWWVATKDMGGGW